MDRAGTLHSTPFAGHTTADSTPMKRPISALLGGQILPDALPLQPATCRFCAEKIDQRPSDKLEWTYLMRLLHVSQSSRAIAYRFTVRCGTGHFPPGHVAGFFIAGWRLSNRENSPASHGADTNSTAQRTIHRMF